jgi:acetyl esterase/lipase
MGTKKVVLNFHGGAFFRRAAEMDGRHLAEHFVPGTM